MRILEISLEAPSDYSGGGIVIKQSILSLCQLGMVDYIGPEFDSTPFEALNIKKFLLHDDNIFSRAFNLLRGITNGYYKAWKETEDELDWDKYDLVHIEFTKFFFILEAALKKHATVLTRVHNVEADYYRNLFVRRKNIKNYIQYRIYKYAEKKYIEQSKKIICLTEHDKKRIMEIYSISSDKIVVNPVCISDRGSTDRNNTKTLLLTGSLWYGPNADGIKWFLDDVWAKLYQQYNDWKVVVAGSNPSDELKEICEELSVQLVENPPNMHAYFIDASIYVAPVFAGAGMKVKIAEALMYGLPIIATKHALIGYQTENRNCFIQCKTAEEFKRAIEELANLSLEEYRECCHISRKLYEERYSIDSSVDFYRNLLENGRSWQ